MSNNTYQHLSKDDLIAMLTQMEAQQHYGLVWDREKIPEKAVLEAQGQLPLLTPCPEKHLRLAKDAPENLLIEGDNLHALLALQHTHAGAIDLIYIDPPYNTGKGEEFMYNDNYVDSEDGYRHSKWLSFMHRRLVLAKNLMSEAAAIFISIDDNEVAQLKLLCHQIFGESNFVAQFIRKNKAGSGHDSGQVAVEFDYMLCFAKDKSKLVFQKEIVDVENDKKYRHEDDFVAHRGKYYLRDLDYKGSYSASMDYPMPMPDGSEIFSGGRFGKPNTWRWNQEKVAWGIENDYIVKKQVKDKWKVYIKQYQFVDNENKRRERQLPHRALIQFLNSEGSQELSQMVPNSIFKFPKPLGLIEFCMGLMPNKELTVLDFFAGSGTTGHAVMRLNAKDGGQRKFILCTNNENGICHKVTYPRIQKAIEGFTNPKGHVVQGLPSTLTYFQTQLVDLNTPETDLTLKFKPLWDLKRSRIFSPLTKETSTLEDFRKKVIEDHTETMKHML